MNAWHIIPNLSVPEVRDNYEKNLFFKILKNGTKWDDSIK